MNQSWLVQPITTVADVNPKRSELKLTDEQLVDFVPMANVAEEFGGITLKSPRPAREVSKGYTQFQAGDVLFAKITPCMENGKIAVVPTLRTHIGYGSTEFHVFRPKSGIHPKWIGHFLARSEFRRNAQRNMSGSAGQLRVPTKWISEQEIPVPTPDIQEIVLAKIDELFSDLDAGVAALKRAQANLKRYRAAVLKAAVEGRLTEQWRAERKAKCIATEPAAQLLARILVERRKKWEAAQLKKYADAGKAALKGWQSKYSEPAAPDTSMFSELPEGWCVSSLGQCFVVAIGATPSRKESRFWNGEIPWVSSGEVQFCRIRATREQISQAGLDNSSTQLNPKGSVLLGMIGEGKTRGQAAILEIDACNNQNCAAIWVPETPILSEFVYYWLVSQYELTRQAGSGNNQPALNKTLVERFMFPLVSIEEQTEIVAQVEAKLSNIAQAEIEIKRSLERAARLRQAILKRAFEGRLV